jgi:type VI secretion system protein ImpJ
MPWRNKVIWSEGLFLRPHHFQQHDRYLEHLLDSRCASLQVHGWGITELEIDKNLLSLGKFSITSCKGILPDGTPFNIPDDAPPPSPLPIPEELHSEKVYLALPLMRRGLVETDSSNVKESLARFHPQEIDVDDNVAGHESTAALQVGQLRLRLLLESEDRNNFACLGLARILESRPDKGVILDEAFLPACLDCSANPKLKSFITELQGLLEHRCEALGGRVTEAGRGGVAEIADFLMLLLVNRSLPLITHLSNLPGLHPEAFYRTALQIAGELATFTSEGKRPPAFSAYQHDDHENTFAPLMKELRHSLSMVLEQNAISIPLEDRKYGVRVAPFADKNLLQEAQFVLAIKADVRQEVLQNTFPSQVKIGSVENIRQMVNSGLPGIGLRLLPVAPRQIPYHAGFTYFELDRTSRYWEDLEQSSAFAVHVSGDFPGLDLEFWAIKG